jgi:NAD dependent epimerase/dehydratase family enzyme
MVLEGQHVIPQRALACGFRFQYPTLDKALAEILRR